MSASRRGSIRRSVVARSPRLSLLLPALIAALLALLAARTGLAMARDAAAPSRGESAPGAPADGATSGDQSSGDGNACPCDGARQVDLALDRESAGVTKRPPCPTSTGSALLPPEPAGFFRGHPVSSAGLLRAGAGGLSPSAPCSQRAPPLPSA